MKKITPKEAIKYLDSICAIYTSQPNADIRAICVPVARIRMFIDQCIKENKK